jgi:DNA polymerase alpha subunit B
LFDLLDELAAAAEIPDVLILMGPFVEADHPRVTSGHLLFKSDDASGGDVETLLTAEEIFLQFIFPTIIKRVAEISDSLHLVLVPAWNDVNEHPVYPQAPMSPAMLKRVLEDPEIPAEVLQRVTCVANPSIFSIGEVLFGVTSVDILSNLNKSDVTKSLGPSSATNIPGMGPRLGKIPRLAQHILEQRNFFPLFPPATGDTSTNKTLPSEPSISYASSDASVPLELKSLLTLSMTVAPDILILPSKLIPFSKPICGSTIAVNPGLLCKGNTGGTYAKFSIAPPLKSKDMDKNDIAWITNDIPNRTKVEVVRI